MSTMREIARRAGVSLSTVSYALNGSSKIGRETAAAVQRIAEELGYVHEMRKPEKKRRLRGNIGVLISNFDGSFSYQMTEEMYHCAFYDWDRSLHIVVRPYVNIQSFVSLIKTAQLDGVIVLHNGLPDDCVYPLRDSGVPLVFLDREIVDDRVSSVLMDNAGGMKAQVEYLIRKGHRRIAYMCGDDGYDDRKRHLAYVETMKKHILPVDDSMSLRGGYVVGEAQTQLLKNYPHMQNIPDAICCSNDDMAVGCIEALHKLGLQVPRDISVCGFDDLDGAAASPVPLTTVRNPVRQLAKQAVLELMRLLEPDEKGKITFLPVKLVVRNSCTAIARK